MWSTTELYIIWSRIYWTQYNKRIWENPKRKKGTTEHQNKKSKMRTQFGKFLEMFRKLQLNIMFSNALKKSLTYTKFLKDIIFMKMIMGDETMILSEKWNTILQGLKIPIKRKHHESVIIYEWHLIKTLIPEAKPHFVRSGRRSSFEETMPPLSTHPKLYGGDNVPINFPLTILLHWGRHCTIRRRRQTINMATSSLLQMLHS